MRLADRLTGRVGAGGLNGTTEPYLCHTLERCEAARGVNGAIVAVDFYERGAAVAVARELNGGG